MAAGDSHQRTRRKFGTPEYAALYASKFAGSRKDARERDRIREGLDGVTAGASVLDLPCGAGRMTGMLVRMGYRVTAADVSEPMLLEARTALPPSLQREGIEASVIYCRQDILALGFADDAFDAVVCNRLFHHFAESHTRIAALRELARVSRGPLLVSYFSTFALSALKRRVEWKVRGVTPNDRIPIPPAVFEANVAAAGLRVDRRLPVCWPMSPQTYLRLTRTNH